MGKKEMNNTASRRDFIVRTASAACILCLGTRQILASATGDSTEPDGAVTHKFLNDSHLTYQQVMQVALAQKLIPTMKVLAEEMGQKEFEALLRKASSEATRRKTSEQVKHLPDNSLSAIAQFFRKPNRLLENGLSYEFVEDSETAFELKVTECLWAKVFREADAATLGDCYVCHSDFAMAEAFNPKIKLHRTKTLMNGDKYCNHRYVFEG